MLRRNDTRNYLMQKERKYGGMQSLEISQPVPVRMCFKSLHREIKYICIYYQDISHKPVLLVLT